MGSAVASRTELRRFLLASAGFAVLFGAIGRTWGEDIALELQKTPTTDLGWLFIGWLISGPPFIVAALVWHEGGRLAPSERRDRGLLLAAWIGLSMFVMPAKLDSVDSQFGTGALVGDPLSLGWAWGMLANVVGFAFAVVVLTVLHRTVPGKPSAAQLDLTYRLLERAWLVLLVVSLGFALYGNDAGIFHSGT
ncbi:MAG: hypothetical protein J7518_14200 [Nocardioidaceae bacterium]|nr:hypothetical protein [Nocardioidaceae bacterium]